MKKRAARHAELPSALFATPDRAATKAVHVSALAMRAVGLAVVVGPADFDELRMRFLIGQPENLSKGQAPCG
jgi:hypothetical protein